MTTPTSPLPTIAVTGRFVTLANRPAHGYVTLTPITEVAGAGWNVVGATVQAPCATASPPHHRRLRRADDRPLRPGRRVHRRRPGAT